MLLFSAQDGQHGIELWRSDGTEAGTVQVQDISLGAASSDPARFTPLGRNIVFVASDGITGSEPWIGRTAILLGNGRQALRELRDELRGLRP